MHRDTVKRSWGPLLCHSSTTITSCCSMIMQGPCCKDLYTIPGSWKHPSSCSMASILTGHVTHWACLGCSGSAYTTACSSSCQYPAISHSHWRGVDNLINSIRRRCVALREENGGHTRYWLVFGAPQYSKTAHFRVAFYCGQPKAHLCNNHAV